jgi:sulfur carrier protein
VDREAASRYLGVSPVEGPRRFKQERAMSEAIIRVVVNGEERELPEGSDLTSLLRALDIPPRHIAIELNGDLHEGGLEAPLAQGDRVEIVRFVGGG